MLKIFRSRRSAKTVVSPSAAEKSPQSMHAALQEALTARRAAQRRFDEAAAAVERVRSVMRDAEDAESAAEEAEALAVAATRRWAEAGAPGDEPNGDQDLLDQASATDRRAKEARFKASGARAGLPAIEEALTDARIALSRAQDDVRAAATEILLGEIEPLFETMAAARDVFVEAQSSIAALRVVLGSAGQMHPWRRFSSSRHSQQIGQRLAALAIPVIDVRALRERSLEWVRRLDELLRDEHDDAQS